MPFFSYTKNKINAPISEYLKKDNSTPEGSPEDYFSYYGNKEVASLYIIHVPTEYIVKFPAIITNYSEDFKPSFSAENVYGRMDAIQRYQNTTRTVSVTWVLPAYDKDHSSIILAHLSQLARFLYPVYDKIGNTCADALGIRESPLLRVRFANLIQKNVHDGSSYEDNGLLVAPTTFNFAPVLETGFFFSDDNDMLFPKETKISMNFTVLHEETPGWIKSGNSYKWIGNLKSNLSTEQQNSRIFPWGSTTAGGSIASVASVTATTTGAPVPATATTAAGTGPSGDAEAKREAEASGVNAAETTPTSPERIRGPTLPSVVIPTSEIDEIYADPELASSETTDQLSDPSRRREGATQAYMAGDLSAQRQDEYGTPASAEEAERVANKYEFIEDSK